jgi:cyclophilin family peptidyl-prolyl cis-trans isomerase
VSRVALLVALAALIGVGAWTAFGGGADPATPAPQADATQVQADAPPADPDPADPAPVDPAPVEGAPTDPAADPPAAEPSGDVPVGDGFAPVPFLSDVPVQSFEAAQNVVEPDLDYRATIDTTAGTVVVDLYQDLAPRTVDNFVFLALHRFYEAVPFHRVIDDFMAQTGDPTGTGRGGPGYAFEDEIVYGLVHDRPGLLSMANAGPDTNGSQFFLTFAATPWLDGRHAIFGEVLAGQEVLDRLTRVDPQNPSILALLSEPASVLVDQGVQEAAGFGGDVEAFLRDQLGDLPDAGQSFRLAGRRGVFGALDGAAAIGLFPVPDRIERVTVWTRAKEDPS